MSENNNVVEKIRKLLALAANDPESEESKLAGLRAEELMTKYNIESVEEEIESGFEGIDTNIINLINDSNARNHDQYVNFQLMNWEVLLSGVLKQLFNCKLVINNNNTLSVIGFKKDIEMFLWYFKLLRIKIYKNMQDNYGYKSKRKTTAKSYAFGYIEGLRSIIYQMEKQKHSKMNNECKDLVLKKDDILQKYIQENMDTRKAKSPRNGPKIDSKAYYKGFSDGKQNTFNEPIE